MMNVLSLFDGMSCGQIALNRSGIKYKNYFASEIDKFAIKVTKSNFPNTIQLGDVRNIDFEILPKIDLLIGGSPCQSFSFAGKRAGMKTIENIDVLTVDQYIKLKNENVEFVGQSFLFWEFVKTLKLLKQKNPDILFLLENVEMVDKWKSVISNALGLNPIKINSSLVSAQNRERLYWTNIGLKKSGLFDYLMSGIENPVDRKILLSDILETNVDEKYFVKNEKNKRLNETIKKHSNKLFENSFVDSYNKAIHKNKTSTITTRVNASSLSHVIVHSTFGRTSKNKNGGSGHLMKNDGKSYCLDTKNSMLIQKNLMIRRLTPIECERLQTVPENYTNFVSDAQRYKMLGNGWTVEIISHIFKYI